MRRGLRGEDKYEQVEDQDGNGIPPKHRRYAFKALFSFTEKAHLLLLVPALLCAVAAGIMQPAMAVLFGRYFDSLSDFGSNTIDGDELSRRSSICVYGLLAAGTTVCALKAMFFYLWLAFGEVQAGRARETLFQYMIEKEVEWFETWPNGVRALLARIQTQVRELQIAVSQPLGFVCTSIVESITSICVAFYHDWRLASVILGSLPVIAVVTGFLSRGMEHALADQNNALENAAKLFIHTVNNILLVKYSNAQHYELGRFQRWALRAGRSYLRQAHMNAMQIGALRFTSTAVIVGALYYGTDLIHGEQTSAGNVLTTFWACSGAAGAFEEIWPQFLILERGCSAAAGLRAVLDRSFEGNSGSEKRGTAPAMLEGDIEFHDVSFAYPSRPSHHVLHESFIFFPAGETTFLVGRSGSGKSTVGALLLRFYNAYRGKISIDGRNLRSFDKGWLRNNITLVQQHSILVDESVSHNIALGCKDYAKVSHGQIQDSVQFAMLHDSVCRLPGGITTRVGRCGSLLSGGQRQRIAIARAHLRDTPVLVLDESTSALDRGITTELMRRIRKWRRGKTTIVITHDTSQIRQDDFVYILREGQVVAEGYRRCLGLSLAEMGASKKNGSIVDTLGGNSNSYTKKRNFAPGTIYEDDLQGSECQTPMEQFPSSSFKADPSSSQDADGIHRTMLSGLSKSGKALNRARVNDDKWSLKNVAGHHSVMYTARPMSMYRVTPTKPLYRPSAQLEMFREPRNPKDLGLIRHTNQHASSPEPAEYDDNTKSWVERLSVWSVLSTIWPSLSSCGKLTFLLGFSAATIHAASLPTFSYLLAQAMTTFYLRTGWQKKATNFVLSMLGVAIGDGIACYLMHYCLEVCGQAWMTGCRVEAMKRVTQQPAEWFDEERNTATLMCAALDRDAEETRNLLGRFAVVVYVVMVMMIVATAWATFTCWKLALVGLACASSMLLSARWFGKVSSRWEARTNNEGEVIGNVFAEAFGDIYTMRALTLESYFHQRYAKASSKAFKVGLQRGFHEGILFGISDSAIHFVTAAIFAYGAGLLRSGSYPVQSILQVLSLLIFSITHANSINSYIPQILLSIDTASRLLRLCQLPLQSHEHRGRIRLIKDNPDMSSDPVRFVGQSFAYPRSPYVSVLSRLNLAISLNKCTAIIGASGSGKSTIASLLLGLYPPSGYSRFGHQLHPPATLLISGLDIRSLDVSSLREHIAIVPQNSTIVAGTVRENILYGLNTLFFQTPGPCQPTNQTEQDDHGLISATKAASIHDFILTLPSGYDTLLSPSDDPGGGKSTSTTSPSHETPSSIAAISLSGGQAQRISIARALARNPRILILDEPTSALDLETADEVRRGIKRYQRQRLQDHGGLTAIVITHSEEMMRWADEVVVLEGGRVVESGVYDELEMAARWRRRKGEGEGDEAGKGKQRARDDQWLY